MGRNMIHWLMKSSCSHPKLCLAPIKTNPKVWWLVRMHVWLRNAAFSKYMLWGCKAIWAWIKTNETSWNGGLFGIPAKI